MDLKDRIREAMESVKLTPAGLARAAQVTKSAAGFWLSGQTKSLKAEKAQLIELATGYRTMWLVSGKGPKKVSQIQGHNGNVDASRAFTGEVPVISWVQAGAWQEAADAFQPGDAERYLPIFRGHSCNTFALRVRGDSMTSNYGKSYPQGSYIIVDPAKLSPSNGDRIVAKLEGSDDVTFKVYKDEDGRKWLAPLNPTHPPIVEPFKIIGTVIGKWEDE